MGELIPEESHQLEQRKAKREIAHQRDRAIVPALTKIADEVERRAKSGQLSKELKGLKVSSLLGNLTRIITAVKDAAPQVLINNQSTQGPDELWLKANSSAKMSDTERKQRRQAIDTTAEKPK